MSTAMVLAALLAAAAARADESPIDRVIALNREAVAASEAGQLEAARKKLTDAVVVGTRAGLDEHKMMARTYLHLAEVLLRLSDEDRARRFAAEAVRVRPDIQPAAPMASAALERLLAELRRPAGAEPTALAEDPPPAPADDPPPAPADDPPPAPADDPPPAPGASPAAVDATADDPLAVVAEQRRRRALEATLHRRPAGVLFLGLGAGTGYGWHPARRLEFRRDLRTGASFSRSGDVLVLPEVGYQLSDDTALSLQVRLQLIAGRGQSDPTPGAPARGAFAALARLQRFIGSGNAHLFASANAGVGDAFRLVLAPRAEAELYRHDTVGGGPLALGPGFGFMYHLARSAAVAVELRALAGLPTFAAVVDLGTSFQVGF